MTLMAKDEWGINPEGKYDLPGRETMEWAKRWLVRKRKGMWQVWRPFESDPFAAFETFKDLTGVAPTLVSRQRAGI